MTAYMNEYRRLTANATSIDDHRKAAQQIKDPAPDYLVYTDAIPGAGAGTTRSSGRG